MQVRKLSTVERVLTKNLIPVLAQKLRLAHITYKNCTETKERPSPLQVQQIMTRKSLCRLSVF
jgi:hypothetical protein